VVESVKNGSSSQQGGLQAGDLLLRWTRGEAKGEFESPFDLSWVEIEQAPRGTVTVQGFRGTSQQIWTLGSANWGLVARPNFSESSLSAYLEAQDLAASGKLQGAVDHLRAMGNGVQASQPSWLRSWLLHRAARLLADARKWREADAAYEEVTRTSDRTRPAIKGQLLLDWAGTFSPQRNMGEQYQQAFEESSKLGYDSLMVSDALDGIGYSACWSSQLEKCEESYSRALGIQQKLAPGSLNMAEGLQGLGLLAWFRGELEKAHEYFLKALGVAENVRGGGLSAAHALNSLGGVSQSRGDLVKSGEYYRRALALFDREDPGGYSVARTLTGLGILAEDAGDLAKAQRYFQQALDLTEKFAPDSQNVAMVLHNLGEVAGTRGDLSAAEQYYRRSLAIRNREDPGGITVERTLANLGSLAQSRGDLAKAENYYQQAVTINEKLAPGSIPLAKALDNLGDVAQERDDLAKAEEYYLRAHGIEEKVAPGGEMEALTLNHLGRLARSRGNVAEADEYYRRAFTILNKIAPGSAETAESLTGLAMVAESRADATAEEHFRQALAIWENVAPDGEVHAQALAALARCLVHKQQWDAAAALFEKAMVVLDSQMTRFGGGEEARSTFRAQRGGYYRDYVDLLMRQKQWDGALEIVERSRARAMLETLRAAHVDVRRGVDADLLERQRSLQADIHAKVDRRIRLQTGRHTEQQLAEVQREIDALLAQYSDGQEQIRSSSPGYSALTQPKPLSARQLQEQLLDDETVLLEYSLGDERSYVWAVTRNSLVAYELPKRAEIENAATRVYNLLEARNSRLKETGPERQARLARAQARYPEESRALSRMVLDPVAAQIAGKRLVIVADGALQYVPFGALPEPKALPSRRSAPLIVDHEIVNLPSASVLAELRQEREGRKQAAKAVAVLADPVFSRDDARVLPGAESLRWSGSRLRGIDDRDNQPDGDRETLLSDQLSRSMNDVGLRSNTGQLPRLRFTRQEARAILAVTPRDSGLMALDFHASREMATSPEMTKYRIVHFATHGLLDNEHPELSGLVLSLVDEHGRQKNGFLDLEDIYNLNLPAELVVLSACETGLGKDIRGEGLIGLTRGFMYAGASRVVSSLWNVDDVGTAELMGRFYKAMEKDKLRPAAALRQAQIEMLKQKDWSAPYYWAAFQMQGEWK
jgi:CHAT domain-containing protein/Tfp pilus assembly protein PilF